MKEERDKYITCDYCHKEATERIECIILNQHFNLCDECAIAEVTLQDTIIRKCECCGVAILRQDVNDDNIFDNPIYLLLCNNCKEEYDEDMELIRKAKRMKIPYEYFRYGLVPHDCGSSNKEWKRWGII